MPKEKEGGVGGGGGQDGTAAVVRPRAPQAAGASQRRGLAATGGLTEPAASPHFLPVQSEV